jgi:hypothetical protein
LRVFQIVENQARDELIERAAAEGLTPREIEQALALERNWREDRDAHDDGQHDKRKA